MTGVFSFFSWITASFMNSIIYPVSKTNTDDSLTFTDKTTPSTNTLVIPDELDPSILSTRFLEHWNKQLSRSKHPSPSSTSSSSSSPTSPASSSSVPEWKPASNTSSSSVPPSAVRPSLLHALYHTFYKEIILAVFLKLGWGFFVLLSIAFFVRQLLQYIRFRSTDKEHTEDERAEGYILSVCFFIATLFLSICIQQMNIYSTRLGVRIKSCISTIIYQKSLIIDKYQNTLDVVSIVSTDVTKLANSATTLHYLWSGMIEALAIIAVLIGFIGVAALPALGLLLFLIPVQYLIGMIIAGMRKKTASASDERVHLMEEILRAIKLVKMYAWERKFAENVDYLRSKETNLARINGILKSLNLAFVFVLPPLIAISVFGTYEALGNKLDGVFAFTALSLFNTLRLPLVQLPKGLRAMAEALAASERIEQYLLSPNTINRRSHTHDPTSLSNKYPISVVDERTIQLTNASYKYGTAPVTSVHDSSILLHNLNMNIPNNSFVMVVGGVGSGKSNLMNAILGQMNCTHGTEVIHGNFAYVPQTPWCAHGTIRDNILFGKPWNEEKYRQVLWACALETDLTLFEDSDLTQIGERGMNLSGGQRQRIALARAAYNAISDDGADIIILDSPLSAVDKYTGQHIMNYCLKSMLKGKIIILVTHQIELLPQADIVIVMEKGNIGYYGPFNEEKLLKYFPKNTALTDVENEISATSNDTTGIIPTGTHTLPDTIPEDIPVENTENTTNTDIAKVVEQMENIIHRSNSSIQRHNSQRFRALTNPDSTNLHTLHTMHPVPDLSLSRGTSTGSTAANTTNPSKPPTHSPHISATLSHRNSHLEDINKIPNINDALNPSGSVLVRALSMRAGILKTHLSDAPTNDNTAMVPSTTPNLNRSRSNTTHALPIVSRQASVGIKGRDIAGPSTDLVLLPPGVPRPKSTRPAPKEISVSNPYWAFLKEMGIIFAIISLAIFVITQVTRIYSDIWVSTWVAKRIKDKDEPWYTSIYGGYIGLFFGLLLCRGFYYYFLGLRTASNMHNKMFKNILKAPMAFFNVTPLGKVLAVFSSDMDTIDELLLDNIHMVIIYFMILCTTISVVIRIIPYFAAIAGGLLVIAIFYFRPYLRASTTLKESAGVTSDSVVAQVSETLQGMSVIQAYRSESRFKSINIEKVNNAAIATYNLEMLQLWLSFRLDFIGCLLVLGTCLLVVGIDRGITASNAGLAISNSFQILLFFSLMVKGAADINANIASVERVTRLGQVVPENDLPLTHESCPPDAWPSQGIVDFNNVVMSYLPSAPHVLKGVTFACVPGEKIGVVGRTGAGKSSLIMALFRLVELSEGGIRVDGINISNLNLSQLRKRISIIPQEPVMFSGTLRSNLDPFNEKTDEEIIIALEHCLLGHLLHKPSKNNSNTPTGLDYPVTQFGDNFSLGEQQLLCLTRAMLNNSRLLLLDEATAALDLETDSKVQSVIRRYFADRTIITIAHRLDTIIDSDRILVMDAGRVAEFDTPYNLLFNYPTSIFNELCRRAGNDQYRVLKAAASRHHATLQLLATQIKIDDYQRYDLNTSNNKDDDNDDCSTIKEELEVVIE